MRKGKDPEPNPDPYLWLMDPEGPKTCGSCGSGSGSWSPTLLKVSDSVQLYWSTYQIPKDENWEKNIRRLLAWWKEWLHSPHTTTQSFPPRASTLVSDWQRRHASITCTRVADPDPDSIGSVDPDSESGSGSRRAKMTHKSRKKIKSSCFEVLDMASFEIWRLLLLLGRSLWRPREVNCSFWSKKNFFTCNFFQFLVIKALDPDWIRIRIESGWNECGYATLTWTRQMAHVSHSTSQLHIATAFHFFSVNMRPLLFPVAPCCCCCCCFSESASSSTGTSTLSISSIF